MMIAGWLAAGFCLILVVMNLASMALAARRWWPRRVPAAASLPVPVSIVRPLRGIEPFSRETLVSTFKLDWLDYEIILCVQDAADPIIAMAREIMAAHPAVPTKLLVGDDVISANPKLNNCVKGWEAAAHDYIVLSDSNVLMPRDYLTRMMEPFRPSIGLVVSMPRGSHAQGFFAQLECAILNTFQARWQYAAEAVGMGFAQGKNMMWRKEVLERSGGIRALAAEIAEDAASTKVVRAQGLKVALVDVPFEQPLGYRTAREVWSRHVRWARLRRVTFPWQFTPEILTGGCAPLLCAAYAARMLDYPMLPWLALVAGLLYGAEAMLTLMARLPLTWVTPLTWLMRDAWLPVMWVDACLFDDFVWHGQPMTVREDEIAAAPSP